MISKILHEDLEYTFSKLSKNELDKLKHSTILITGCGGFLGQYHLAFFYEFGEKLNIKKVIGIDNFMLGKSPFITEIEKNIQLFDIKQMDICSLDTTDFLSKYDVDYVVHMASIASPTYYRKHPIETLDSNVWGLRNLLDIFSKKNIKGFLFYSSSEIYGNPLGEENIPTNESYWGNVSPIGPRACYDEAKRFGETLCYYYEKLYSMPVSVVRLFNIYGPGMNLNDRRAPADFANSIISNRDIEIYSDGTTTRSFCYVADSVVGELKALLSPYNGAFNIGLNEKETTIRELAETFIDVGEKICCYKGEISFEQSKDAEYLVHDPSRRCPDLSKARTLLHFEPTISLEDGVERYIRHILEIGENAKW